VDLGGYRLEIHFSKRYHPDEARAGGLILSPRDGEFVVVGFDFFVKFHTLRADEGRVEYLGQWECEYKDDVWAPRRRFNGDEYGIRMGSRPSVQRAVVFTVRSEEEWEREYKRKMEL